MKDEVVVSGYVVPSDGGANWLAPFEKVQNASLTSLGKAFLAERANYGDSASPYDGAWGMPVTFGTLRVSMAPTDELDRDYSPTEPYEFSYLPGAGVVADTIVGIHGTDLDGAGIRGLLSASVDRLGARVVDVAVEGAGTQAFAAIRTRMTRRGTTVRQAHEVAKAIQMLVASVVDGKFGVVAALDLVRAGRGDLLVGMAESEWLEVKSQLHPIDTDAGRIELAQDVARFANSDTTALLIIGMTIKRKRGEDVITSLRPAPTRYDTSRLRRAVDRFVFPPVEGLAIENAAVQTSDGSGGYLVVLHVPAQPEELKPFLVHGAVVDGRVEGAFISIVRRRGEDSVPVRPESIHSALAAGRALLRHGRIPDENQR